MTRPPESLPFKVPIKVDEDTVDVIKIKLQFSDGHLFKEIDLRVGVIPHWFFSILISGKETYWYEVNEYEGKTEIIAKILSNSTIKDVSELKKYSIIKERVYIVT